jgi:hypothetical protein
VAAFAAEHHRLRRLGQAGEGRLQPRHQGVVERVALRRSIQAHVRDGSGVLDVKQVEPGQGGIGG